MVCKLHLNLKNEKNHEFPFEDKEKNTLSFSERILQQRI